jgi:hypothetical protein
VERWRDGWGDGGMGGEMDGGVDEWVERWRDGRGDGGKGGEMDRQTGRDIISTFADTTDTRTKKKICLWIQWT